MNNDNSNDKKTFTRLESSHAMVRVDQMEDPAFSVMTPDGKSVADIPPGENAEAYAKLFAAAPELLDALQKLGTLPETGSALIKIKPETCAFITAAISKALGK